MLFCELLNAPRPRDTPSIGFNRIDFIEWASCNEKVLADLIVAIAVVNTDNLRFNSIYNQS